MSDAAKTDPTPSDPGRGAGTPIGDATLERQVLELVRGWMRRSREASAAHTEAAIDRGSFESFPASDPVAPVTSSTDRAPSLERIDCTMTPDELIFRAASVEPDATRGAPAWLIEGAARDGGHLCVRVWVDDSPGRQAVPETLGLERDHASIRPRQHERRSGTDRRTTSRAMPAGFDRRVAERRAADGVPQPESAG